MPPPTSDLFAVQEINHAGRGVVASDSIHPDTVVYQSTPPAAHVVFRQYRQEVCADCFFYDRGQPCHEQWRAKQGAVGLEAWTKLHDFIQSKSKSITNNHSLPSLTPKPDEDEVRRTWEAAGQTAMSLRQSRASTAESETILRRTAANSAWPQVVDPDILSYLLSGCLYHNKEVASYMADVAELEMDTMPYRSTPDLQAHSNSYIQLTACAPGELLSSVTESVCQTLISAASHNSFGIHAGSTDGDEYLGYGLYPGASYFNHSCRPNIRKQRVGAGWEFRASKGITPGEQCCITYLGGDEEVCTVTERRSRLKVHWGFTCACKQCVEEAG
ncbi:Histone-lysine N-methyltransferase set-6 [Saxophila tyrrhenica]|uniref:Histone-lysine N-methyltransferase set-6 n=1 Tax=Saxophila tyrrhenica TaxID=1690608 RepID=A0AAV9PRF3_9PEZI|nr:Histone-lysine N-methyltransferase set-6 [Saxophila tyrrhenica]